MSESYPRNGSSPSPKRIIATVILLILLCALLAGLWWWNKNRVESINRLQQEQLAAALDRQKALAETLAAIPSVNPETCPPGQVLRPIDSAPSSASLSSESSQRNAKASSAPALAGNAVSGPSVPALKNTELAARLEQATAMVLVENSKGLSTGTGFFISPNLLITNHHVVQGSKGSILLASHSLKSVRRASILLTTKGSDAGSADFALLRLEDGTAPGFLPASTLLQKLASVIAAGFPGMVVENDAQFTRLLAGDSSSAPDLNLTQGSIQSLQTGTNDIPLIIHTAAISKGNSGGPLVDQCGRLIGINTFINVDRNQSSKISYALGTETMMAFLADANVSVADDTRNCAVG